MTGSRYRGWQPGGGGRTSPSRAGHDAAAAPGRHGSATEAAAGTESRIMNTEQTTSSSRPSTPTQTLAIAQQWVSFFPISQPHTPQVQLPPLPSAGSTEPIHPAYTANKVSGQLCTAPHMFFTLCIQVVIQI